jgi:hypothetical protein
MRNRIDITNMEFRVMGYGPRQVSLAWAGGALARRLIHIRLNSAMERAGCAGLADLACSARRLV